MVPHSRLFFRLVMVREGVPSTSFVAGKLVDGRPRRTNVRIRGRPTMATENKQATGSVPC
jgi:hypothetical protein